MNDKLKPCPFCGGEAELFLDESCYYKSQVYCKKCGVRTNRKHIPEIAVTTWNTRKPMDKVVRKLESLETYTQSITMDKHPFCASEIETISKKKAIEIVRNGVNNG